MSRIGPGLLALAMAAAAVAGCLRRETAVQRGDWEQVLHRGTRALDVCLEKIRGIGDIGENEDHDRRSAIVPGKPDKFLAGEGAPQRRGIPVLRVLLDNRPVTLSHLAYLLPGHHQELPLLPVHCRGRPVGSIENGADIGFWYRVGEVLPHRPPFVYRFKYVHDSSRQGSGLCYPHAEVKGLFAVLREYGLFALCFFLLIEHRAEHL